MGEAVAADATVRAAFGRADAPALRQAGVAPSLLSSTNNPGTILSGLNGIAVDPSNPTRILGTKAGNSRVISLSTTIGGGTITDLFTFPVGESVVGLLVLPTGTILATTTDVASVGTPSTFKRVYRSADGGLSFTKVADLTPGGYLPGFGMAQRDGTVLLADYGFHGPSANSARYVYRSTNDGAAFTQVLDVGSYATRHIHACHIDPDGTYWVSTGDGAGNRVIFQSTNAASSWTQHVLVDDEGIELQALDIESHDGWLWAAIDDPNRGGIMRWKAADPEGTVEVVYSNGDSYEGFGLLNSSGMQAPAYSLARDPKYGAWYAYFPGEVAGKRGRFMASTDGLLWSTLYETGDDGVVPLASRFEFDGSFAYYGNWRIPLHKPYRHAGQARGEVMALTFTWPGTIADRAEWVTVRPDHLGFDFRVLRISVAVRVAGTAPISVLARNAGASLHPAGVVPTIAANATGTGRQATAAIITTPTQRLIASRTDALTMQVYATGGGEDLTVILLVEKAAGPVGANVF